MKMIIHSNNSWSCSICPMGKSKFATVKSTRQSAAYHLWHWHIRKQGRLLSKPPLMRRTNLDKRIEAVFN